MSRLNGYRLRETGEQVQEAITQVRTKTIYDNASQSERGLMSKEDKKKLDEYVADDELSIAEINSLLNF